jgi:eukaryotic-like serine/threonine-protein kinase
MNLPRVVDGEGEEGGHFGARNGPLTGSLLSGKWRVGRLLGRGGMSSVYAATHRNGKECAIKVLHPDFTGSERTRKRFLREGYIANRVGHDGVVSVLDDDATDNGIVYLVMDLLEGSTLESYRQERGGTLPVGEVLAVADAILDVLIAAHARGIVHRDIKPANVFLTTKGTLKLLDFGIASLREGSTVANATQSGVVLGTPGFIAPEQARGRWNEIDARTDLWGLGATMFRLLTGRLVHDGETSNESVIAAATQSVPSLASLDASLPPGLVSTVDRAMMIHPRARWQSALEMKAAVHAERNRLPTCALPRPAPEERGTLGEASVMDHTGSRPSLSAPSPSGRGAGSPARYAYAALFIGALVFVAVRGRNQPSDGSERTPNPPPVASRPEPAVIPSAAPAAQDLLGGQAAPEPVGSLPTKSTTSMAAIPSMSVPASTAPPLRSPVRGVRRAGAPAAAVPASSIPSASAPAPTRFEDILNEHH